MALGRRSRGRRELHQTAEINVTSLVDVAFTLLIIFIITAPMLQGGLTVDLPQGEVKALESMEDLFLVTIDRDGKIYWKDNEVTITELEGGLGQWAQAEGTKQLFIKADSAGHFGPVYRVWTAAAANGLLVSILGEPKPPTP